MSSSKIATINSSSYTATYADADTALVPQIILSNSGQLTIQSATGATISASDLQLAANKGLSLASGSGSMDFSGGSGIGKTTTGAQTIGPGTVAITGNTTVSASSFDASGTTTFKVPVQFYIAAVQTSANVTGTNLNTLTAGSSSNADTLHTHTAVQSSAIALSGLTLWSTPAPGEVGYISANNTLAKAKADALSTSGALGAYAGTSGSVLIGGKISLLFESGLTLSAGDRVFLSDSVAGRVTNVAPTTSGHTICELGRLLDASSYNSGAGSAQACVWDPRQIISIG